MPFEWETSGSRILSAPLNIHVDDEDDNIIFAEIISFKW